MCFLAVMVDMVAEFPVVVAANRDEYYDRPGTEPGEIAPGIWGGRDPRAGGTWLGINARGVIVAVANIASAADKADAQPCQGEASPLRGEARSRGLLCLDLLRDPDFPALPDRLATEVRRAGYSEFNLLAANANGGWIATFTAGQLRVRALGPGVHVIGNRPPDGPDDPKVARGRGLLTPPPADIRQAIAACQSACRDHGVRPDRADAICIHGPAAGTLSSSIICPHRSGPPASVFLHAQGPPCLTEYRDVSPLLRCGA